MKDMDKFKNYISYKGNKKQLRQFAAELIKAGFIKSKFSLPITKSNADHVITYPAGRYAFHNHPGAAGPLIFTSDQAEEALKAATELAE